MKKIVYMLLLFMFASCDKADINEPSTADPNKWTLVEIQEPLMSVFTRGYKTPPKKVHIPWDFQLHHALISLKKSNHYLKTLNVRFQFFLG